MNKCALLIHRGQTGNQGPVDLGTLSYIPMGWNQGPLGLISSRMLYH